MTAAALLVLALISQAQAVGEELDGAVQTTVCQVVSAVSKTTCERSRASGADRPSESRHFVLDRPAGSGKGAGFSARLLSSGSTSAEPSTRCSMPEGFGSSVGNQGRLCIAGAGVAQFCTSGGTPDACSAKIPRSFLKCVPALTGPIARDLCVYTADDGQGVVVRCDPFDSGVSAADRAAGLVACRETTDGDREAGLATELDPGRARWCAAYPPLGSEDGASVYSYGCAAPDGSVFFCQARVKGDSNGLIPSADSLKPDCTSRTFPSQSALGCRSSGAPGVVYCRIADPNGVAKAIRCSVLPEGGGHVAGLPVHCVDATPTPLPAIPLPKPQGRCPERGASRGLKTAGEFPASDPRWTFDRAFCRAAAASVANAYNRVEGLYHDGNNLNVAWSVGQPTQGVPPVLVAQVPLVAQQWAAAVAALPPAFGFAHTLAPVVVASVDPEDQEQVTFTPGEPGSPGQLTVGANAAADDISTALAQVAVANVAPSFSAQTTPDVGFAVTTLAGMPFAPDDVLMTMQAFADGSVHSESDAAFALLAHGEALLTELEGGGGAQQHPANQILAPTLAHMQQHNAFSIDALVDGMQAAILQDHPGHAGQAAAQDLRDFAHQALVHDELRR